MNRQKKIGILVLCIFVFQIALSLTDALGYQDDNDLEITMHGHLTSDSSEIHSSLIPTGTFDFYDKPALDVATSNHDLTNIDINQLQYPTYNSSQSSYTTLDYSNITIEDNYTISNEIDEYTTSGGFHSRINLNLNHSLSEDSRIASYNEAFTSNYWDLYGTNRDMVIDSSITNDATVNSSSQLSNYGNEESLDAFYNERQAYFGYDSNYLLSNYSADSKLRAYLSAINQTDLVYSDDLTSNEWDLIDVSEERFNKSLQYTSNYITENMTRVDWSEFTHSHTETQYGDLRDFTYDSNNEKWYALTYRSSDENTFILKYNSDWSSLEAHYDLTAIASGIVITAEPVSLAVIDDHPDDYTRWFVLEKDKYFGYDIGSSSFLDVNNIFGASGYPDDFCTTFAKKGWENDYWMIDADSNYASGDAYRYQNNGPGGYLLASKPYPYGSKKNLNKRDTTDINWDGDNWYLLEEDGDVFIYNENWGFESSFDLANSLDSISSYDDLHGAVSYNGTHHYVSNGNTLIAYEGIYEIEKFYKDLSGGYYYAQTDTTEDLLVESPTTTERTIHSGARIETELKTSNNGESLYIEFYNDGIKQYSQEVQSGSTSQTIKTIYINEDITFDQIKFNGTNFDDTEYFYIYDIKVYDNQAQFELYSTSSFDEDSITWDNKPALSSLLYTSPFIDVEGSFYTFDLTNPTESQYIALKQIVEDSYGKFRSSEYATNNPYIINYLYKNYQDFTSGYAYIQTNETEELILRSPEIINGRYCYNQDTFNIDFQTTSTNQIQIQFLENGKIVKSFTISENGNSNFDRHTEEIESSAYFEYDQIQFNGTFDDTEYFKVYGIERDDKDKDNEVYYNAYVQNFQYTVLGYTYSENFTLYLDSQQTEKESNYVFYFDSSMFNNRSINHDFTVENQNVSVIITYYTNRTANITSYFEYSYNSYKVPTEVDYTINDQEIIDETYKSGYVHLSEYPSLLEIDANKDVIAELNLTIYFTFTFDLDIISKTYLKKSFELLSDHDITIDSIDFDTDLSIKKIYLNNKDIGSSNPITVNQDISQNNIYTLEVILREEVYTELSYIKNDLGSGTANSFIRGLTNKINFQDISQYSDISYTLPEGFEAYQSKLTFSDINYKEYYESNSSEDISDYGYTTSDNSGNENVEWSSFEYYEEGKNGSKSSENSIGGYYNIDNETFNSENAEMSHSELMGYNNSYSVNSELSMSNQFPNEQKSEDFLNWNLNYDSDYTTSSFSNGDLESTYKEYTNSETPNSYSMNYGSYVSSGDLSSNNGHEDTIRSTDKKEFKGDHTFEGYIGSFPSYSGWYDNSEGSSSTYVVDSHQGRDTVFRFDDKGGGERARAGGTFANKEWTTFEYMFYASDGFGMHMYGSGGLALTISVGSNGEFSYYTGGGWAGLGATADMSEWNMVSVEFDTSIGRFDFWLNGIETSTGNVFRGGSMNYIDEWYMWTGTVSYEDLYLDSVSYYYTTYNPFDCLELKYANQLGIEYTFDLSLTSDQYYVSSSLSYDYTSVAESTSDFEVYDDSSSSWVSIGSSPYSIDESYYNANYELTIKFYEEDYDLNTFDLLVDQLSISYTYEYGSGVDLTAEITKDVSFSFLNRYDSNSDYQNLYNVSIEFDYTFTIDNSDYSDLAEYMVNSQTFSLTKDGSSHSFSYNFQFDSSSVDTFSQKFEISNGLLELSNYEYDLVFECLDVNNLNNISQYFKLDPELSLDYLHRGEFYLNFSIDFTQDTLFTYYSFHNSLNYSLFSYNISIKHEDGWNSSYFNTNSSITQNISFNISNFLSNLGKSQFLDYKIEFYVSGNNTQLIIDNIYLYDYDNEFYNVSNVYVSDYLLVYDQNITLSFKAIDRYCSYVEIYQTLTSKNLIFNQTLLNNTLQQKTFSNETVGFYELELKFYDDLGNYEIWALNYTIITLANIKIAYQNPALIGDNATFSVQIRSKDAINHVHYDNSTNYILEYDNSSYPLYNYTFSFTVSYDIETNYNISIRVAGHSSGVFYCNITNLEFLKRSTRVSIHNLKSSYEQDDAFNISIDLRDLYNNPLENKVINYTLQAPNDSYVLNSSDTTDSDGEITITQNFTVSWDIGFYHLNISFVENDNAYLGVWELTSFKILPVSKILTNCSDINLKVNNNNVSGTTITLNETSSFTFEHLSNATFDLGLQFYLNYSESISYSDYFDYSYTFEAKSDITHLTIISVNLTSVPTNFTKYYIDDSLSSNYTLTNDNLQANELKNEVLYNDNSFSIKLRYYEDSIERTQITSNPITTSNEVIFQENLLANRSFKYWYFENDLTINSISLEHIRTSTTISSFETDNNSTNRYYFSQDCENQDLFEATTNYDPNWDTSITILEDSWNYTKIQVKYKADLDISNVSLITSLNNKTLFNEKQSDLSLTINTLDFGNSYQTLIIEGYREQITSNPLLSDNSVEFNQTFYYNSEIISKSNVIVDPKYSIEKSFVNRNTTKSNLIYSYYSEIPIKNVIYKSSVSISECFDKSWKVNNNFSSFTFDLNPLNFTIETQTKNLSVNLTQVSGNYKASLDSTNYILKVYDNITILTEKELDVNPVYYIEHTYQNNNPIYSEIVLDYQAELDVKNVSHKVSMDIIQAFGNNWNLGNSNSSNYEFSVGQVNFTETMNDLVLKSYLSQITTNSKINLNSVKYNLTIYKGNELLTDAILNINPSFYLNYSVMENNGTYTKMNITIRSAIPVNNVDIYLNLNSTRIYNEKWGLNGMQSLETYTLTIPDIDISTDIETFEIEGVGNPPNATIYQYEQVGDTQIVSINGKRQSYYFKAYIDYLTFSKSFYLQGISRNWTLDGVHYKNSVMDINKESGYFECEGFGPSITSSYLKFYDSPVIEYKILDNKEDQITIYVKLKYPVKNAMIWFQIPSNYRYEITSRLSNLTSLGEIQDVDHYTFITSRLRAGEHRITINYRVNTLIDKMIYLPFIIILIVGMVGYYLYMKRREVKEKVEGMSIKERNEYLRSLKKGKSNFFGEIIKSFRKFLTPGNKFKDERKEKEEKIPLIIW